MSKIARAVSPQVAEPQAGTWSNCLVVNGVAYVAGMTAAGTEGDEYAQAKVIFTKIRHLLAAAGGNMADVVKVTIFVTDITQREKVWHARRYRQLPGFDPRPGGGAGKPVAKSGDRGGRASRCRSGLRPEKELRSS
jgi:2-iminobutanoate/2-iminopropanoate deaminase